jgi:hypothetical protein
MKNWNIFDDVPRHVENFKVAYSLIRNRML